MQKVLLFLILIGRSGLAVAQNWALFQPETSYYFKRNDADIITNNIFITSSIPLDYSILHELNKVILPCDTCSELEEIISNTYTCSGNCVWLRNQAQFAGNSLLSSSNGSWQLHYGDSTVVVLSHASPGAEWEFSPGITANVTGLSSSLFWAKWIRSKQ